ncbi:hypothetical protein [Comamonas sp. lk]|uniref:hypothetical protein n=1 Tax=Comamonas sp. lk TaxID=2201272 RepID=UPI0013CE667E|nr:hypothetical protein [Comamonas sp. lk]
MFDWSMIVEAIIAQASFFVQPLASKNPAAHMVKILNASKTIALCVDVKRAMCRYELKQARAGMKPQPTKKPGLHSQYRA